MENMFVWIVMFSGAAVLLLGVFLVASERELKKKRAEINDLVSRLEGAASAAVSAPTEEATANGAELADLRAKNQVLQKDRATLQDDLEAAHRAIDDLRAEKPASDNGATLAEIQQLRGANTQLDAQVEELRVQLQASEAKLNSASSTGNGSNERQTQLENSLIELKQQLEKSQAKNRELESSATNMVDVNAMELRHREETDAHRSRIAELESILSANAASAQRIVSLEQRIGESETLEQELRAALRQREDELPLWQERLAASDEIKKRLLALQPVFDQLVAKQDSVIEHQLKYRGELESFAQFLSASHDGTLTPPSFFDPQTDQEGSIPGQLMLTPMPAGNRNDSTRAPETEKSSQLAGDADIAPQGKRGFGGFHALIVMVVGGALAALFWSQGGDQPVIHAAKPLPISASVKQAVPAPIPDQVSPSTEPAASTPPSINKNADAPEVQNATAKQAQAQSVARSVSGTYEVTRGTRVYAAPTEFAQQVGDIEPGLKVNVVNARDGWLEIHSKHGRPPGFIRSDAVARVGG